MLDQESLVLLLRSCVRLKSRRARVSVVSMREVGASCVHLPPCRATVRSELLRRERRLSGGRSLLLMLWYYRVGRDRVTIFVT